ncbi:hypothetical protein GGR53DRAFT_465307 [Hypoxylon sp. FL1150]|nr:hypothetical protein GGR53DRAFT_465307 [Hypoxylon sp. FL1150]
MAPTQLPTIVDTTRRFILDTKIDLNDTSSQDDNSLEELASEFNELGNEKLLAIILRSIAGIFIILGLVWLGLHIHRQRLARRAPSPSFQELKDVDSRNPSREDVELGPTIPAPAQGRLGDRRRNSH